MVGEKGEMENGVEKGNDDIVLVSFNHHLDTARVI